MNTVTREFLIVIVAFTLLSGLMPQSTTIAYKISPESKVWVEGTSTIHDWTCGATEIKGTVELTFGTDMAPAVSAAQVTVPIKKMDCDNSTMDRKLQKALKMKDTPNLLFEFESATTQDAAVADSFEVATLGYMMIAGQTRRITVTQYLTERVDGTIIFRGSFPVSMKDYGVKPPTALLGTIRTGNEVTVFFKFVLDPSRSNS